jgi:adenine-specific DNA methylase
MSQPRRLIEVDLPIREISRHARREKSIRHGHLSTLHIWWARRPLAACRAVVLAALLPDPADPECPEDFRYAAAQAMEKFRDKAGGRPASDSLSLRRAILEFIARFAAWESSTDPLFLGCARDLVAAAYPDGHPLVVDPFAGGGAIPLEALRVGADAWASDYNPVATLLLKVLLEDIPRHGERLAVAVRTRGERVKQRVEADLGRFYPPDPDGGVPIAYLWARTVICEGPDCGAEIPLLRQLWLARKDRREVALHLIVDRERRQIDFEIEDHPAKVGEGTSKNGAAICPVCHIVTPRVRVERQLKDRRGGTRDARLVAVVIRRPGAAGRFYRIARKNDAMAADKAAAELARRLQEAETFEIPFLTGRLNPVRPSPAARGVSAVTRYGMTTWGDLFLSRQALSLTAFAAAVHEAYEEAIRETDDRTFARAVASCLAIAVDRQADMLSSLTRWVASGEFIANTFARQALAIVWDFAEANPFSGATGDWDGAIEWIEKVCRHGGNSRLEPGQVARSDARALPLPNASVPCIFTDPPYYDQIPYSDLSDFFAAWLSTTVGHLYPDWLSSPEVEKRDELVVNAGHLLDGHKKDSSFFRHEMRKVLQEARRVLTDDGVAVLVFAHKETEGWEALLGALIDAGWTVTGSWPLETERAARTRAQKASSLQSSIHIVCRPRSERAGVGDWRQIRGELQLRVAEWLPRLSREGIEGADAIFACLGPAMEVYSRFERVETAAGDPVPLAAPKDDPEAPAFLPAVWAAVAREALQMIFAGPQAEGFEEDARLTALWLWTLRAAQQSKAAPAEPAEIGEEDDEESTEPKAGKPNGLALDYDTARKLAQALGVHLEDLGGPSGIVEVRKGVARLLPVTERRMALLPGGGAPRRGAGTLFELHEETAMHEMRPGATTLDRVHQAMLVFADGRSEALRRLLGQPAYLGDSRFRRLAQALSSLYPANSPEQRWIDGVLTTARGAGV